MPKFGYLHHKPSSDAEGIDTGQISLVVIRGLDVICGPLPTSEMPSYRLKYPAIFSRLKGLHEHNADIDHLVHFNVVTDNGMPDGYILMEGDDGTFLVIDPDGNILGVFIISNWRVTQLGTILAEGRDTVFKSLFRRIGSSSN